MRNLKPVIERYLSRQTQHAIVLTGSWGKGKTFFYQNYLQDLIKNTSIDYNALKKYKPVYVSLFGLRSVEEMQAKIALDLLSYRIFSRWRIIRFFQKRNGQLTLALSKLLLKGILLFKGLDNLSGYLSVARKETKKHIGTREVFICFDDLERRSPVLNIEEFTGYVNSLVENNIKVLIICNEKEVHDKDFYHYKEKIVGTTIEYMPETAEVVDSIINTRYSGSLLYKTFLHGQKRFLIELADRIGNNYRHLIYSLDCLHDIYSILKAQVLDARKDYSEQCNQEIGHIAKFTLIMAIEFKSSNLSYSDSFSLKNRVVDFLLKGERDIAKSKIEVMLEGYYENKHDYKYYDSIFGFVTGANDFTIEEFVREFKSNYRLENGKVLPEYQVLNDLDNWKALTLTDEEYKEKTLQMLEYARLSKFLLAEYQQVYFYCERFNNPLNFDLQQLSRELKIAMTVASENKECLQSDTASKLNFEHGKGYDEGQEEIRLHGLQLLDKFENEREEESKEAIIATFLNNLDDLHNKYHGDEKFKHSITWFPVFKMLDIDNFLKRLVELRPFSIKFLSALLKDRYNAIKYWDEAAAIAELNRKLCDYLNLHQEKTRKIWALNEFQKQLNVIENKYGLPVLN